MRGQNCSELFGRKSTTNGRTKTYVTNNFGILAQPMLLGCRLSDFMNPDEANPSPNSDQSTYGIGDLPFT